MLLPSVFAGGLFSLLGAYCNPQLAQSTISTLGSTIAPIVLVVVGFITFIFYRFMLGENILYPLRHGIHRLYCSLWRRHHPEAFVSFISLLANEGVPWGQRRFMYSELRDSELFFAPDTRQRLDLIHASYHCLYLTAFETVVAAWYQSRVTAEWRWLLVIGIVAFISAYWVDLRFDTWECKLLLSKRADLQSFLSTRGFSK